MVSAGQVTGGPIMLVPTPESDKFETWYFVDISEMEMIAKSRIR